MDTECHLVDVRQNPAEGFLYHIAYQPHIKYSIADFNTANKALKWGYGDIFVSF